MRKIYVIIMLCILMLVITGCSIFGGDDEIKPESIGGYNEDDASDLLAESKKLDKKAKSSSKPTATPLPFECKEIEYKVFVAINEIRVENNLSEFQWDDELYDAVLIRAKEISKKFSHTRPDGSTCFTVSKKLNGENIAKGYSSADKVVDGWMNSSGHRENILNDSFTKMVIGYYKDNSGIYWVQGFER